MPNSKPIKLLIEIKNDDLEILMLYIKTKNTNIIYRMTGRKAMSRPKLIEMILQEKS